MSQADVQTLTWVARLFLAISVGALALGGRAGLDTYRFLSESVLREGTVVDWTQGESGAGPTREPGAYFPVIEIVEPDGRRLRGAADTGVDMYRLQIGERLPVRYRPADPERMRIVSFTGLWLREGVFAILAGIFGAAGVFLRKQARQRRAVP